MGSSARADRDLARQRLARIRRLSKAVAESCLVDGHFCGEDMSPPQLREGSMTGVIAVRHAAYPAWCAR
jgi:hypothetical protein